MSFHCMVNAFSLALNMTPAELVVRLGHDGKATHPGTEIQVSHHVQEILDVSADINIWFTLIELLPSNIVQQDDLVRFPLFFNDEMQNNLERFNRYLSNSRGVLLGTQRGVGHAVYWDGKNCIDGEKRFGVWDDKEPFEAMVYWRQV